MRNQDWKITVFCGVIAIGTLVINTQQKSQRTIVLVTSGFNHTIHLSGRRLRYQKTTWNHMQRATVDRGVRGNTYEAALWLSLVI